MTNAGSAFKDDGPAESPAERSRRVQREAELIAEAEAEARDGLLIPQAEIHAWIDSLGSDEPLPKPKPRTRR